MTIIDPISDMFTRIRNAISIKEDTVKIPSSKILISICRILKDEGFINSFEVTEKLLIKKCIYINLKYNDFGSPVITKLIRASKPSKRVYVKKSSVPKPLNGFGISLISTSKGVMSGRQARIANVGGELLGIVF